MPHHESMTLNYFKMYRTKGRLTLMCPAFITTQCNTIRKYLTCGQKPTNSQL